MTRKAVKQTDQMQVLVRSKRRCALCYGLGGDLTEKTGQIAHLNQDNSDASFGNLVWLCLDHHDQYDSITRQSKNYTLLEVKTYRDRLYAALAESDYSEADFAGLRTYLRAYSELFEYLFAETTEVAFKVHPNIMDQMAELRDRWQTSKHRSFNNAIAFHQDRIAKAAGDLMKIYAINEYDLHSSGYIKFDNRNFPHSLLVQKRSVAAQCIAEIGAAYADLQSIARS